MISLYSSTEGPSSFHLLKYLYKIYFERQCKHVTNELKNSNATIFQPAAIFIFSSSTSAPIKILSASKFHYPFFNNLRMLYSNTSQCYHSSTCIEYTAYIINIFYPSPKSISSFVPEEIFSNTFKFLISRLLLHQDQLYATAANQRSQMFLQLPGDLHNIFSSWNNLLL